MILIVAIREEEGIQGAKVIREGWMEQYNNYTIELCIHILSAAISQLFTDLYEAVSQGC